MAGHNKWSKIKHKKAAGDAQKSKLFSKISRLLTIESRNAEGNIESPALRSAIERARSANMPQANIEKAINKGNSADSENMEAINYEAYGPGGAAMIITALTDNRNKSAAEIKYILSKNGYPLSEIGSATWAFEKKGNEWQPNVTVEISKEDSNKLINLITELEDNDEVQEVFHNAI